MGGAAYYDDQLNVTWTADANINGLDRWDNQLAWAASLMIDGIDGWRLPNMDRNGDTMVVNCATGTQTACMDNEYGHLFHYGAGTTLGSGVTAGAAGSPDPFSNIATFFYWSSTEFAPDPTTSAWDLNFNHSRLGRQNGSGKFNNKLAWAVRSGDISAVPIPAATWLFGSALVGLLGLAKCKQT